MARKWTEVHFGILDEAVYRCFLPGGILTAEDILAKVNQQGFRVDIYFVVASLNRLVRDQKLHLHQPEGRPTEFSTEGWSDYRLPSQLTDIPLDELARGIQDGFSGPSYHFGKFVSIAGLQAQLATVGYEATPEEIGQAIDILIKSGKIKHVAFREEIGIAPV
jgi:hypothetical protein